MSYKKAGTIPAKADPQEQSKFLEEELQPRLDEAERGEREVWFADASHFLFGAVLGYLWCRFRLFVKSPGGRKRLNVLGAVNAQTRQVCYLSNDTTVNQTTVVQLIAKIRGFSGSITGQLDKLKQFHLGKPVTLVLDNAKYQKTEAVRLAAKLFNVELLYLPAYSPNLNLIERLWKWVKKEALACNHLDSFADFQAAIELRLDQASSTHKDELASLLTLEFQMFDCLPLVPA